MADVLVVYFSRSGTTERLARDLARLLDADVEALQPVSGYAGAAGFLKGVWHSIRRRSPPVETRRQPVDHGLVVIATPVWAGHVAAPVRTYLERFKGRFPALAGVWVSGSGNPYPAVATEIEALAGRPLIASEAFAEKDVRAGHHLARLQTLTFAAKAAA